MGIYVLSVFQCESTEYQQHIICCIVKGFFFFFFFFNVKHLVSSLDLRSVLVWVPLGHLS